MTAQPVLEVPVGPVYRDRQLLTAALLNQERAQRTEALQRHLAYVHPATDDSEARLAGLELQANAADQVWVLPGFAVTATGDYLGLSTPVRVERAEHEDVQIGLTRRGGRVAVVVTGRGDPPPPGTIPLGEIEQAGRPTVRPGRRVLPAVAGQRIAAPDGAARLDLGPTPSHPEQAFGLAFAGGDGQAFVDCLTVDNTGCLRTRPTLKARGEVSTGHGLEMSGPAAPAPDEPRPWRIHLADTGTAERPHRALRVALGDVKPGTDPASVGFTVVANGKNVLRVDARGTLTLLRQPELGGTRTVVNPPPAGPATSLADLAARTGETLAQAARLLSEDADTDLTVRLHGVPEVEHGEARLTYSLRSSSSAGLTRLAAYETVVAAGDRILSGFVAREVVVPRGSEHLVHRIIDLTKVHRGTWVEISVLAVAVGPDGKPRSGTLQTRVQR